VRVGAEDAAKHGLQEGALVLESTLVGTPSSSQDILAEQGQSPAEEAAVSILLVPQVTLSHATTMLTVALHTHSDCYKCRWPAAMHWCVSGQGLCSLSLICILQESRRMEADLQQAVTEPLQEEASAAASHKRQADAVNEVQDGHQQMHIDKRIKLEV